MTVRFPPPAGPITVLGIDGCRGGWVGIVLVTDPDRSVPTVMAAVMAPALADVVDTAVSVAGGAGGSLAAIGVDMPLHIDGAWPRAADAAARAHLGRKASSLFVTPPAAVYDAPTYAEACAVSRELTGGWAPSRQAWGLGAKIDELRAWRPAAPCGVFEVHPEVSFSLMTGAPILARKTSWAGHAARRAALAAQGIVVPDDIGPAGLAGADDVADAAAVAWSARRLAAGEARSFPDDPPPTPAGEPDAIWA